MKEDGIPPVNPSRIRSLWTESRWGAIALLVVATGLSIVITGLFVIDNIAMSSGCGSIDPTDPANYSVVKILNDTPGPVDVTNCRGQYCDLDHPRLTVAPGRSVTGHAACRASGPDMTSWQLTNSKGLTLGYIVVSTPRKRDGLVFAVSHPSSGRLTPSQPV